MGAASLAALVALVCVLVTQVKKGIEKEFPDYAGRVVEVSMGQMNMGSMGNIYHLDIDGDGRMDRAEWIPQGNADALAPGDSAIVSDRALMWTRKITKVK